ncbi:MAG: hypothetical protein M3460_30560, partial [Actinomycetota bacterium]|nr:hypothetical protein [Actinomycetota bacterium]
MSGPRTQPDPSGTDQTNTEQARDRMVAARGPAWRRRLLVPAQSWEAAGCGCVASHAASSAAGIG